MKKNSSFFEQISSKLPFFVLFPFIPLYLYVMQDIEIGEQDVLFFLTLVSIEALLIPIICNQKISFKYKGVIICFMTCVFIGLLILKLIFKVFAVNAHIVETALLVLVCATLLFLVLIIPFQK